MSTISVSEAPGTMNAPASASGGWAGGAGAGCAGCVGAGCAGCAGAPCRPGAGAGCCCGAWAQIRAAVNRPRQAAKNARIGLVLSRATTRGLRLPCSPLLFVQIRALFLPPKDAERRRPLEIDSIALHSGLHTVGGLISACGRQGLLVGAHDPERRLDVELRLAVRQR